MLVYAFFFTLRSLTGILLQYCSITARIEHNNQLVFMNREIREFQLLILIGEVILLTCLVGVDRARYMRTVENVRFCFNFYIKKIVVDESRRDDLQLIGANSEGESVSTMDNDFNLE